MKKYHLISAINDIVKTYNEYAIANYPIRPFWEQGFCVMLSRLSLVLSFKMAMTFF